VTTQVGISAYGQAWVSSASRNSYVPAPHDHRADAGEEALVVRVERVEAELQQPVDAILGVGDEAVDRGCDIVESACHAATVSAAEDMRPARSSAIDSRCDPRSIVAVMSVAAIDDKIGLDQEKVIA
jgi:hypothetical protein